jgi:hypothetical protein
LNRAREAATLAVVVFPTPPLPMVTTTTRGVGPDSSGAVHPPLWPSFSRMSAGAGGHPSPR